jgi:hypothetical protein
MWVKQNPALVIPGIAAPEICNAFLFLGISRNTATIKRNKIQAVVAPLRRCVKLFFFGNHLL